MLSLKTPGLAHRRHLRRGRPLTLALLAGAGLSPLIGLQLHADHVPNRPPAAIKAPAPAPVTPMANKSLKTPSPYINDQTLGGRSSDLLPIALAAKSGPTPVKLRSAEVTLVEVPLKESWKVSENYELFNPGAAAVGLSLLFPEDLCPPERECTPLRGAFQDLTTRFGDKVVQPLQAPLEAMGPWATVPGKGYLYRINVPPQHPTHLVHEFRFELSRGSNWWGVHHISSAGHWAGPIEKVHFTVELQQPVLYVIYPRAYKLTHFEDHVGAGGTTTTKLQFLAEGLATRTDFQAIFPADGLSANGSAGYCTGFRGDQLPDDLAKTVRSYSPQRRIACRNQIYALHGIPFTDPALRKEFYETPRSLPAWADNAVLSITNRSPNPNLRENQLSPGEQAYLKALANADAPTPHP